MITPKQKQHITGACITLAIGGISLLGGIIVHEFFIYTPALLVCIVGILWMGSVCDTIKNS